MTAPKAKKSAAAKKAVKKPVKKAANKKASVPVKKTKTVSKPVAVKVAAHKTPAKKASAKKPPAKQAPTKKASPVKAVAKKAVAKKATAKKVATTKVVTKKSASVAPAKATHHGSKKSVAVKVATKSAAAVLAKSAVKKTAPKPASTKSDSKPKHVSPPALVNKAQEEVQKKSPRAAKAISLMPPPPGQVVASTSAKASYTPMSAPQISTLVPKAHKKDAKLANNWKSKPVQSLSDAEVLAMPDSEYMNDTQMSFFRLKLTQLKTEILANAEGTTEHLREDTVVVPDPADRATIEEEHALELRTRDRERKLLKKIEQSIARIDAGDYGYCDETGEPIGVGRLLARPTATLSLEAQQRRELKQKMFGD